MAKYNIKKFENIDPNKGGNGVSRKGMPTKKIPIPILEVLKEELDKMTNKKYINPEERLRLR